MWITRKIVHGAYYASPTSNMGGSYMIFRDIYHYILTFGRSVIIITASSLRTYQRLLYQFAIPSHSAHQIHWDEAFTCILKVSSPIFDHPITTHQAETMGMATVGVWRMHCVCVCVWSSVMMTEFFRVFRHSCTTWWHFGPIVKPGSPKGHCDVAS